MKHGLLLLCVVASTLNAQSFEGKIVYKNSYEIPKGSPFNQSMAEGTMGTGQEYFAKGGAYKTVAKGGTIEYAVFVPSENRIYSKYRSVDTLYWTDVTRAPAAAGDATIVKDKGEVLGLKCDALVVETMGAKTTYFFNPKYPMDPKPFKDHKFGGWNVIAEKAQAYPLKMIFESQQLTLTMVATEVLVQKIDDKIFELPKNLPLKKSPL